MGNIIKYVCGMSQVNTTSSNDVATFRLAHLTQVSYFGEFLHQHPPNGIKERDFKIYRICQSIFPRLMNIKTSQFDNS